MKTLIRYAIYASIILIAFAAIIVFKPRIWISGGAYHAECSMAKDLASQLTSAKEAYEKETGKKATGFRDYVVLDKSPAPPPYTITLAEFKKCFLAGDTIFCPDFPKGDNIHYLWNGGKISLQFTENPTNAKHGVCRDFYN